MAVDPNRNWRAQHPDRLAKTIRTNDADHPPWQRDEHRRCYGGDRLAKGGLELAAEIGARPRSSRNDRVVPVHVACS